MYLRTDIVCLKADDVYITYGGNLRAAERELRLVAFQNVVVHHLNVLLGSKPRISKEGNRTAIFYE